MTLARTIEERPRVATLMGLALLIALVLAALIGSSLAGGGDTVPVSELRAAEERAAKAEEAGVAAEARANRLAAQERAAQRQIGRLEQRLGQWVAYYNERLRAQRRRVDQQRQSRPAAATTNPR